VSGYRHAEDTTATPREIVTALHEKMAARSPELAELVARFNARQAALDAAAAAGDPRGREATRNARAQRIRDYSAARDQALARGLTPVQARAEAAPQVGVTVHTAEKYDTLLRERERQAAGGHS